MIEAPAPAAESSPRQPPLGISHLLLWMLGTAVVLSVYRGFASQEGTTPEQQGVVVVNHVCLSLLAGINIAAVIVYARRLVVRDAPLLVQPGHWLLAIAGASNVLMWLLMAPAAAISLLDKQHRFPEWAASCTWLAYSVGCFAAAAFHIVAMLVQREPRRWPIYFLVSAVFSALLGLVFGTMFVFSLDGPQGAMRLYDVSRVYMCLYPADQLTGIVILLFNLIADRADRRPRDWLHRVGVVVTLLQSAAVVVFLWLLNWVAAGG